MNNSFSLNKVTVFKVTKILSELNIKKATGIDGISARFLRDTACTIAPVVTHIFNLSIEKSTFPTEFKNAKVIPIYKKGIKSATIDHPMCTLKSSREGYPRTSAGLFT